jgi:hypothetical protein
MSVLTSWLCGIRQEPFCASVSSFVKNKEEQEKEKQKERENEEGRKEGKRKEKVS